MAPLQTLNARLGFMLFHSAVFIIYFGLLVHGQKDAYHNYWCWGDRKNSHYLQFPLYEDLYMAVPMTGMLELSEQVKLWLTPLITPSMSQVNIEVCITAARKFP
uniref:Uncharacterized protein n=1 Tax=Setaria digitata TaxID=48799 RepID=A0A915PID3_9BILA